MRIYHLIQTCTAHFFAFLLCLAVLYTTPRAAFSPAPAYEGYLVRLVSGSAMVMAADGPLEYIAPDLYRTDDLELAQNMLKNGTAISVEPDYFVTLDQPVPASGPLSCGGWSWDVMGGAGALQLGLTGQGVRIAVIDSGIDPENVNLQHARIVPGKSYVTSASPLPHDTIGHGTKVAQMIAGSGAEIDACQTERGLAPDVELVPLQCFGPNGKALISSLISAIEDALFTYHCDVINMSWGMIPPEESNRNPQDSIVQESRELHTVLQKAHGMGVILVAAAGNSGNSVQLIPACWPEVISVAALTPHLKRASFSQKVSSIDVAAPGSDLAFADLSGHFVTEGGTSFAAPCISALAALTLQVSPNLNTEDIRTAFQQRASLLLDDATGAVIDFTGSGIVRADVLLSTDWTYRRDLADQSFRLLGWQRRQEGGGTSVVAGYQNNGQMLGCGISETQATTNYLGFAVTLPGEATVIRHFVLNHQFIPIAPAA